MPLYTINLNFPSGLLLGDFKSYENDTLQNLMDEDNALRFIIPLHYTCVLESCDIGKNKLLKDVKKRLLLMGAEGSSIIYMLVTNL